MTENSNKTGRFVKGQSGNPGGRPAKLAELTSRCKDMTPDVLDTIQNIIMSIDEKSADRLTACRLILEYGYGKASQVVAVDVRSQIENMSREELDKQIAELIRENDIVDIETVG